MKNQGYLKLGLVIGLLLVLTGARSAPAASVTGCGTWRVIQSPNPTPGTTEDAFLAVTRVSASQELWAVGYENSSPIGPPPVPQTLIEHWDGTSWSVVPSPSPGTSDNALTAVTAVAANDIWAVGHMQPGSSGIQNASLVEHWDGSQWLVVSSPNVGSRDNLLSGVAADSASSAWAVGTADGDVGPTTTFILHWNGSQWAVTPSPSPGSSINALAAPVALSATNAWAVGYFQQANRSQRTLTEHWNGKNWKVVNSPNIGTDNNDLNALAFIAGTNQAWTVGEHFSSDTGTSASLTLFRC